MQKSRKKLMITVVITFIIIGILALVLWYILMSKSTFKTAPDCWIDKNGNKACRLPT